MRSGPRDKGRSCGRSKQHDPEAAQSFLENFLTPVSENLRTAGRAALVQGRPWNSAAGPILVAASAVPAKDIPKGPLSADDPTVP
ncbi:hypothetical protein Sfulv_19700 [Streptomyces fulvorobeus]|uniref:Uncharacterized protein n=1 Tax=Streptomyces fulvorobeus TaxID=284028 RepID=A0A7J0C3R8_9ACTN|nr:hypothetical protein Sfulv_19700 [Streptomyces fulvorobeus]